MRQVLRAGALGRPRGMGWGGRWEGGSGRGTHVNPWLIHVNVWKKPLQYCKVISLQLIKINGKKKISIPWLLKIRNKKPEIDIHTEINTQCTDFRTVRRLCVITALYRCCYTFANSQNVQNQECTMYKTLMCTTNFQC